MLSSRNSFSYCTKDASFIFRILWELITKINTHFILFYRIYSSNEISKRIQKSVGNISKFENQTKGYKNEDELWFCCPVLTKISAGHSMQPLLFFSTLLFLLLLFCPSYRSISTDWPNSTDWEFWMMEGAVAYRCNPFIYILLLNSFFWLCAIMYYNLKSIDVARDLCFYGTGKWYNFYFS